MCGVLTSKVSGCVPERFFIARRFCPPQVVKGGGSAERLRLAALLALCFKISGTLIARRQQVRVEANDVLVATTHLFRQPWTVLCPLLETKVLDFHLRIEDRPVE